MNNIFTEDLDSCLKILNRGGVILYPTDTIWGIGCDATDDNAVTKIYKIKKREESKSMIVLLDDFDKLKLYVRNIHPSAYGLIEQSPKPLTVIFDSAKNLSPNVIADDGSIAIRIVKDDFCKELIRKFGKPIISTSANISGANPPVNFSEIIPGIIHSVDYAVKYRQDDLKPFSPSRIIKLSNSGEVSVIRE